MKCELSEDFFLKVMSEKSNKNVLIKLEPYEKENIKNIIYDENKPKVIFYGNPVCQWCARAKALLVENNIEFADYNVSLNDEKRDEAFEKSGQTAIPIIDFNKKIIIGFDKEAIEEAIKNVNKSRENSKKGKK